MPNQKAERPQVKSTGQPPDPGSSLYRAQVERTLELTRREKLRNDLLTGQLIRKDVVEKKWFQLARQVRDALRNIPARAAGLVAPEKSQDKCFAILQKEIDQALEGLAK